VDHYAKSAFTIAKRKNFIELMKQKLFLFICCFCTTLLAMAQDSTVEMADTMRKEGKIYVVVAVILAIFAGIILYLIRLDRKITRFEKEEKLNSIINNKR